MKYFILMLSVKGCFGFCL